MDIGYIFAVLTILCFGSWAVPTKTLKIESTALAFWLTVGHLLLSILVFLFVSQSISLNDFIGPFMAGVLWAIGIVLAYIGIKNLGITRALGIWVPVIIITSTLWGLIYFKEALLLSSNKLILTIVSILLLIVSGLAVIISGKNENKIGNFKIGLLASLAIGLIHGSFFVPLRTSSLPIFVSFLPLSIGMVTAMSFIVFFKKVRVKYNPFSTFRMVLAGLILGGGNYTALLTIQNLGVSQGYPLTQLGIIVNALWGVLVFKEVTTVKGKMLIVLSIAIALSGALLLNIARPH